MTGQLRCRVARPASARWNVAKTLLQTAVFWTVFLGFLPALVYWLETYCGLDGFRFGGWFSRAAGGVLFVLGGSLGLASGLTMAVQGQGTPLPLDGPRRLVLAGPYRWVRNPMAIAGLSQGVAVGLLLGSPAVVLYALLGGPVWNYLVRPWEERDLERRFGTDYEHYRQAVRCWWPRRTGYRLPSPNANRRAGKSRRTGQRSGQRNQNGRR